MVTFQFDPHQAHQVQAVESVVEVFEGYPAHGEARLLSLVHRVQERNGLPVTAELDVDEGPVLVGDETVRAPHVTVEMETGTGKTYVYLRTLLELHKRYGWSKYVLVVPSVAIYQGVIKTVEVTRSHFAALYGNEPITLVEYDGSQPGRIRGFAADQGLHLLLMTRDSLNKASNNFYKVTEKLRGEKRPFQYVQETRPVVILDEPQNMNTEQALAAVRTLHPLAVLRYSATHKRTPNLVYRLTPVDAYTQGLVKGIEVVGLAELGQGNAPSLRLLSVTRHPFTAKVLAVRMRAGLTEEAEITLRQGSDLHELTKREEYCGYVVADIRLGREEGRDCVEFENGAVVSSGDEAAGSREAVFRAQIEKTIEVHLRRQAELRPLGVKVLSLFFIDRVRHFTAEDGMIKRLFDECFDRMKGSDPHFASMNAAEVREGYFARKQDEAVDTQGRAQEREAEQAAFALIMKDKERLLSFAEPVAFLFAHSALKEGWDNPNVFQICTLNETRSLLRKRQEIGRGLRLAVDQRGVRVSDPGVNVLTVVANESYERYVQQLQQEYADDGYRPPAKPRKPGEAVAVREEQVFASAEFRAFWERLNRRVECAYEIDTDALVEESVGRLDAAVFPEAAMVWTQGRVGGTGAPVQRSAVTGIELPQYPVFDLMERVAAETDLTRRTVLAIWQGVRPEQKEKLFADPEGWCAVFLREIRAVLQRQIADSMRFDVRPERMAEEIEVFFPKERRLPQKDWAVTDGRGLYDKVTVDSAAEREWVESRSGSGQTLFQFPAAYRIRLPKIIGDYTPEYGVIGGEDPCVLARRGGLKARCAAKYFAALGIAFRVDES
ncbi:DEAD/DEAH box helicase family protein [Tumebacillus sp. DT12]|uniref:DEAD/DEAH box helicase family protein n=1 Tax=Tumebacillus lacus TaxID=2995335 RepID=A0ABT3X866_9BACL|nr:DEAD/DEAH box helicase family protein [Tumebacillus lacus]MCX7570949.1 DEAD/DEAH box helicase family protein [Tumebacillus lacus]